MSSTKYGPSNIDPGEWTLVGNFYQGNSEEAHDEFGDEHRHLAVTLSRITGNPTDDLGILFDSVISHANGGCASCGARYVYGAVFVRGESELIAIGHDCASNLFGLTNLAAKAKSAAAKARKRAKILAEWEAFVAADPELAEVFGMLFDGAPIDLPRDHEFLTGERGATVSSIRGNGRRYGSLSDKQVAYVKKIGTWHKENLAKRHEAQEAKAEVPDVPEGRIDIVGTVRSSRWVENDFGGALKMLLVSDEGWKVWGTVPGKIQDAISTMQSEFHFGERSEWVGLVGSRVSFSAQVERSKDDRIFGFYKRPTKPVLIEAGIGSRDTEGATK